jgi:hypothetical protein
MQGMKYLINMRWNKSRAFQMEKKQGKSTFIQRTSGVLATTVDSDFTSSHINSKWLDWKASDPFHMMATALLHGKFRVSSYTLSHSETDYTHHSLYMPNVTLKLSYFLNPHNNSIIKLDSNWLRTTWSIL